MTILPGEDPLILGRCNYDTLSPKRRSNVSVIGQGVSDEAIGDVKLVANDDAVTYLRIKRQDSDKGCRSQRVEHINGYAPILNYSYEVSC